MNQKSDYDDYDMMTQTIRNEAFQSIGITGKDGETSSPYIPVTLMGTDQWLTNNTLYRIYDKSIQFFILT